jgi:hypothetical protein
MLVNFEKALIDGLIWTIMWGSTVIFIEIYFPHLIVHAYPKELQEVINLPPFTNKKTAYIYSVHVLEYI